MPCGKHCDDECRLIPAHSAKDADISELLQRLISFMKMKHTAHADYFLTGRWPDKGIDNGCRNGNVIH